MIVLKNMFFKSNQILACMSLITQPMATWSTFIATYTIKLTTQLLPSQQCWVCSFVSAQFTNCTANYITTCTYQLSIKKYVAQYFIYIYTFPQFAYTMFTTQTVTLWLLSIASQAYMHAHTHTHNHRQDKTLTQTHTHAWTNA